MEAGGRFNPRVVISLWYGQDNLSHIPGIQELYASASSAKRTDDVEAWVANAFRKATRLRGGRGIEIPRHIESMTLKAPNLNDELEVKRQFEFPSEGSRPPRSVILSNRQIREHASNNDNAEINLQFLEIEVKINYDAVVEWLRSQEA